MEKSIRPFMVILIILLSIVISSGGTYLFVDNESSKEESNLQSQINDLEKQLTILKNSSVTDETANWKTYTNTKYGFSFKYPKEWESTKKEETKETSLGTMGNELVLKVTFSDPSQKTNEITSQNPLNNIFVRVFKPVSITNLNTWLISTFKKENTELADYSVGKTITLGGQNGYLSDISCCAGYDKSYFVTKDSYVYGLGTNHFESDIKEDPSGTFSKVTSTFQFTK